MNILNKLYHKLCHYNVFSSKLTIKSLHNFKTFLSVNIDKFGLNSKQQIVSKGFENDKEDNVCNNEWKRTEIRQARAL